VELAEEHFAKAVRADRFKADTALGYADFLVRQGKATQAERVLLEARAKEPRSRQVLSGYARLLLLKQDWTGAQELGEALRELGHQDGQAEQILAAALSGQGKHEDSIRLLEEAVGSTADPTERMRALVEIYVRARQTARAKDFLRAIVRSDYYNGYAHALLGWVQAMEGSDNEAETSYRRSIEQAPELAFGYQGLAQLLVSQGHFDKAQRMLRRLLDLAPDNRTVRFQLATVLERAQDYEGAIGQYEQLVAADPSSSVFANNLASLLSERRSDEASLSRAYALASKLSTTRLPQFLDTLGWILYRKGELTRAVPLLKAAADGLPDDARINLRLGLAYKQLGQVELATAALNKAAVSESGSEAQIQAVHALEQLAKDLAMQRKT
jgi:Flp pilus assembly protein TadD